MFDDNPGVITNYSSHLTDRPVVNLSGYESCFLPTLMANSSLDFENRVNLFSNSSITPLSHRPTRGPKFASGKASPRPFCFGQAGLEGDICVGIAWGRKYYIHFVWGCRRAPHTRFSRVGSSHHNPHARFSQWGLYGEELRW